MPHTLTYNGKKLVSRKKMLTINDVFPFYNEFDRKDNIAVSGEIVLKMMYQTELDNINLYFIDVDDDTAFKW